MACSTAVSSTQSASFGNAPAVPEESTTAQGRADVGGERLLELAAQRPVRQPAGLQRLLDGGHIFHQDRRAVERQVLGHVRDLGPGGPVLPLPGPGRRPDSADQARRAVPAHVGKQNVLAFGDSFPVRQQVPEDDLHLGRYVVRWPVAEIVQVPVLGRVVVVLPLDGGSRVLDRVTATFRPMLRAASCTISARAPIR
jgi:hypothetical protein